MKLFMLYIPTEYILEFLMNEEIDINHILNKAECKVVGYEWLRFYADRRHSYFPLIMKWLPEHEAFALMHAFYAIKSDNLEFKKNAIAEIQGILGVHRRLS